jgi:hypothetical protein
MNLPNMYIVSVSIVNCRTKAIYFELTLIDPEDEEQWTLRISSHNYYFSNWEKFLEPGFFLGGLQMDESEKNTISPLSKPYDAVPFKKVTPRHSQSKFL